MKKFDSQICTTREQSERLLSLGLRKETADMLYRTFGYIEDEEGNQERIYEKPQLCDKWNKENDIPAWSLHRLIEMLNIQMQTDGRYVYLADGGFDDHASMYDNIIDCIEWHIKGGYFNKEYLVNQEAIEEHCKGVLEYLDYIRKED